MKTKLLKKLRKKYAKEFQVRRYSGYYRIDYPGIHGMIYGIELDLEKTAERIKKEVREKIIAYIKTYRIKNKYKKHFNIYPF